MHEDLPLPAQQSRTLDPKNKKGEGAREGSKIIFEMDGISALARPWVPLLFPPSFPIAAAIDESPNGRKRRGTFYIFPYTRDDETRIRSLARSESPQGGWKASPLFFLPVLIYPVRHGSKEIFGSLFHPNFFFHSKFIFIQLGQGKKRRRKLEHPYPSISPRNVPSTTRDIKSFVPRLIKGALHERLFKERKNKKFSPPKKWKKQVEFVIV